ncbi:MAG TPA: hypothetical protein VIH97_12460 [Candidatus Acidoferrales bacterium]
MSKPIYHIYLLSRLVFADATDWQKILKELSQGRKNMFWSYKPLRNGAFRMASQKDRDSKAIYHQVSELAKRAGGERCQRANLGSLSTFEKKFLPQIQKARNSYMEPGLKPIDFGEIRLAGGPHFSVLDRHGDEKFVYLHPSANWDDRETEAFCELLTAVVENRHNASARDVWFLDLRRGIKIPWNSSKKRVREKCKRAAAFLVTLKNANAITDDSE